MENVIISAGFIGGATLLGSLVGVILGKRCENYLGVILAFAAGVMLLAAINGLIMPSVEGADALGVFLSVLGIFVGGLVLYLTDRVSPLISRDSGARAALLFALAVAIHNLPEGIAAGIGYGAGDIGAAARVSLGIALHNIPEGMVVTVPLVSSGVKPMKAFLLAASGGVAEVLGSFIGYFAATVAAQLLPFTLAFAGGTMLYAIAAELMPESLVGGRRRAAFALIAGLSVMLFISAIMS